MEYNSQRLSKRHSGGFPRGKKSQHNKHFGPFMCKLNAKNNRCVQSGDGHDAEHCRLNENNNCALVKGHEVHHLEHPRAARSSSPRKKRASSGSRKSNRWLVHALAYYAAHPELSYQEALKAASKIYVKVEDSSRQNEMKGGMQGHYETARGKIITVDIDPSEPIMGLKFRIFQMEGFPPKYIHVSYAGRDLHDELTFRQQVPVGEMVDIKLDTRFFSISDTQRDEEKDMADLQRKEYLEAQNESRKASDMLCAQEEAECQSLSSCLANHHVSAADEAADPTPAGKIKVFYTNLVGRKVFLHVFPNEYIETVKSMIHEKEGVPPYQQRLTFNGRELEDDRTLADYNITNKNYIYMHKKS
jgi:ubiquitin C